MVRGLNPEHCTHPCAVTTAILIQVIVAKIIVIVIHGGWWVVGRGLGLGFEVRGLRGPKLLQFCSFSVELGPGTHVGRGFRHRGYHFNDMLL